MAYGIDTTCPTLCLVWPYQRKKRHIFMLNRGFIMGLNLSNVVTDTLPSTVKQTLAQMSDAQQSTFEEEYKRKMKVPMTMQLLAIFFPIQHFLMGKTGAGVFFWITGGGFMMWYLVDIFTIGGRVRNHNEEIARSLVRDMKIMGN
jgi:hypothetical protein